MNVFRQCVVPLGILFLSPPFALSQEQIIPQPSDLTIDGTTTYLSDTKEYRLTQDTSNQAGNIFSKSICAKEYKVSFDVFAGDRNADVNGGAGVIFYEIDAKTNNWMNVVELNVQDRARTANYNFLELAKFGEGSAAFVGQRVPFPMGGAGYMHLEYSMNQGVANALLVGGAGVVSIAGKRTFVPGTATKFRFYGWTGVARNLQKIKNFQIEVLRPDNCSGEPSMSLDEARQEVITACGAGACEDYLTFVNCASGVLDGLNGAGGIDLSIQNSLLSEYQNKMNYCSGQTECRADLLAATEAAFQRGFAEGAASINQEAIKRDAFARGVQSVDVESIRRVAYNSGYAEGAASIDVDEIANNARNEGYQNGLHDGAASVDVEGIRAEGYSEGFRAGKEAGYADGYDAGLKADKVSICHVQPKKRSVTITVSIKALKAHLGHGDTLGNCPASTKK